MLREKESWRPAPRNSIPRPGLPARSVKLEEKLRRRRSCEAATSFELRAASYCTLHSTSASIRKPFEHIRHERLILSLRLHGRDSPDLPQGRLSLRSHRVMRVLFRDAFGIPCPAPTGSFSDVHNNARR